jgi:hypothetical protein
MRRAGCIRLGFGVESGSDTILREMRKKHSLEKLKEIMSYCNDLGITVDFSLVTNSFSETTDTLSETKDYLLSLLDNYFGQIPSIDFLTPIIGTSLYEEAQRRGLVGNDDLSNILSSANESRFDLTVNLTQMDTEYFLQTVSEINKTIEATYKRKHPIQAIASAIGNLDHFRLNETIRFAIQGNLMPLFEGLLWIISRGNSNTMSGKIYKRIVYNNSGSSKFTFLGHRKPIQAHAKSVGQ